MVYFDNKDDENEVVMDTETDGEDIELEEEEGSFKDKLSALRAKLKACEDEKRAHLEELSRMRADFLNSRKRLEEQLAKDKERATDKLLVELLTLFDSFDTAMADKALWDTIDEKWRTGVEAINTKLSSILRSNNLEAMDPLGLPFNPNEHEAVTHSVVADESQVDTITAVLQKGFKRNGSVVRPARVVVGVKE